MICDNFLVIHMISVIGDWLKPSVLADDPTYTYNIVILP